MALISLCAALAALLEALLVPLYAGRFIAPAAVVLALAGNLTLPRMARSLVPTTLASALPLVAWIAVMFLFLAGRPEGDIVFPGKPGAVVWTFYATLFGGVLAGIVSVVAAVPPPERRATPKPPVSR